MDFWRIWRLISRRLHLIAGLVVVAAVLVILTLFIQNQRAGVIADARLTLQQPQPALAVASAESPTVLQTDQSKRISELATQLAGNNSIYLQAAELLRMDEEARKKEVLGILERNQYFAPFDTMVADKVEQKVAEGELPATQKQAKFEEERARFRQEEVGRLAAPRDGLGAFAPEGVKRTAAQIANEYRESVEAKPVVSLMDTESVRQFDNQIQLLGHFQRENEALLYLNMLTVAFLDYYAINSQANTRTSIAGLLKKKMAAEKERTSAVQKLATFRNKDRDGFSAIIGQDATGQAVQTLESRIAELKATRDAAQQGYNTALQNLATTSATITVTLPAAENQAFKLLNQEVDRLSVLVAELEATKGENDPSLVEKKTALQEATKRRDAARKPFTQSQANPLYLSAKGAVAESKAKYLGAQAALLPYEEQYRKLMDRLRRSPALQAEYTRLMGELEQVTKNLGAINQSLQREQNENIQSSRTGTILITRAFVLPTKSLMVTGAKLLLYTIALALILGIAIVVGLDALDNAVRTKKDAEEILGLPVAGEIPAQLPDPRRAPRVTYLDPLSPTAEAYRLLRTDILFTQLDHPFRSLLVATVKPGQGATTTVSNLAIALAQTGKKVILVDADLRHPSLHLAFGLSNDRGLTTLLTGAGAGIDEVLQRTEVESLLVLTAGPLPLNPSELIGSLQMRELHERLKSVADIVLFDAPSAIAFSDTSLLASFVDSTLLVIRAGDVPRGAVEQVKTMLTRARANLIGVVLNAAPSESVDSVHYHNQYYPRLKSASQEPQKERFPVLEEERFERLAAEDDEDDEPELLLSPQGAEETRGEESEPEPVPHVVPVTPVILPTAVVPESPSPSPAPRPVIERATPYESGNGAYPIIEAPRPVLAELPQGRGAVTWTEPQKPSATPLPSSVSGESAVVPQTPVVPLGGVSLPEPVKASTAQQATGESITAPVRNDEPSPVDAPEPRVWELPRDLPRLSETVRQGEPLRNNWSTSPMHAEPEQAAAGREGVLGDEDNRITFEFEDEDADELLDDFDDDFDEDDSEGAALPRKKPARPGGVLGWFRRGRS